MIIEMISKAIFLDVLAVYIFCSYNSNNRQTRKPYSNKEDLFLNLLTYSAQIVPLVYIFTPWLDFADYPLSLWFSLAGAVLFIVALWLLGNAHSIMGHNFLPRLEIGDKQASLKQGVYHYFRHPIQAGFWLWGIAQPMLLHNWIAGFSMLVIFLPIYFAGAPREEKKSPGHIGEVYRKYTEQTGRIIKRLKPELPGNSMGEREKARLKVNNGN